MKFEKSKLKVIKELNFNDEIIVDAFGIDIRDLEKVVEYLKNKNGQFDVEEAKKAFGSLINNVVSVSLWHAIIRAVRNLYEFDIDQGEINELKKTADLSDEEDARGYIESALIHEHLSDKFKITVSDDEIIERIKEDHNDPIIIKTLFNEKKIYDATKQTLLARKVKRTLMNNCKCVIKQGER